MLSSDFYSNENERTTETAHFIQTFFFEKNVTPVVRQAPYSPVITVYVHFLMRKFFEKIISTNAHIVQKKGLCLAHSSPGFDPRQCGSIPKRLKGFDELITCHPVDISPFCGQIEVVGRL